MNRIAVITDIHGNLPALQASLEAIDAIGVDEIYCGGDLVGYGPHPERGLRADPGARDPDDLRQLRLRDRPRPRRLRLRVRDPARPRARPAVGRLDARAHRSGREGLHARAAVRPALPARRSGRPSRPRLAAQGQRVPVRGQARPAVRAAGAGGVEARCSCSATPTSRGSTPTAACCSSTAARSASPRTATRAPRSRSSKLDEQGPVRASIERVPYDAEAVAREVAAAGLPGEYAEKLVAAA